jgi:hypothetical protein
MWRECFHDMRMLSKDKVLLPSRNDFLEPAGLLSRSLGPAKPTHIIVAEP